MPNTDRAHRVHRNAELLNATALPCSKCDRPTIQVTPTRTKRAVCSSCQKS